METSRFGPGRMSRRTVLITASVAGFAVLGLFYWYWSQGPDPAHAGRPARAAVPVSVATASRQDVPVYLTGLGTVQALFTVGIHAQVDGKLKEVFFKEGQRVQKGDVLAKIDPRLYQAALDQAKAHKAQDEATLTAARQRPLPLPDARGEEHRNPAEPRPATGQGRSGQGIDRRRRCGHRDRANQSRLHRHRGDQRRPHGRAHGRSGQHRPCQRPGRDRDPHPDRADHGDVHAAGANAGRRARCDGARRRRSRGLRPQQYPPALDRHADDHRQPDRSDHRKLPPQGDIQERRRKTVAGRIRQCPPAGRHPQRRRRHPAARRSARAARAVCLDRQGGQHRRAASDPDQRDGGRSHHRHSGVSDGERIVTDGQYKLQTNCSVTITAPSTAAAPGNAS